MNDFIEMARKIYPISDEDADLLKIHLKSAFYPKGSVIIQEGRNNNKVYFVESGLVRNYVFRGGKEYTTWFAFPGEPIVMTIGNIAQKQTLENAETVEDSVILTISRDELEHLFCTSLGLCNWGRRLADGYLCELENLIVDDLTAPAMERYIRLLKKYPTLIKKVPLKHLASYLLITPESLSRIRAQIKNQ